MLIRRRLPAVLVGLGVAAALLPTPALADLTAIGPPGPANSWLQHFEYRPALGPIDLLYIEIDTGFPGRFEPPALRDFDAVGWAEVTLPAGWDDTVLGAADGPGVTTIEFDLYFQDPMSAPLAFKFSSYPVGSPSAIETLYAEWDDRGGLAGWGWVVSETTLTATTRIQITPTPAPAAMGLGLFGLWFLGCVRRRLG